MESLNFRATFNVLAAGQPELIAHLSGFRQRDWPVVIINLAQSALVGGAVTRPNTALTPPKPAKQHQEASPPVANTESPEIRKLSPAKVKQAFTVPS